MRSASRCGSGYDHTRSSSTPRRHRPVGGVALVGAARTVVARRQQVEPHVLAGEIPARRQARLEQHAPARRSRPPSRRSPRRARGARCPGCRPGDTGRGRGRSPARPPRATRPSCSSRTPCIPPAAARPERLRIAPRRRPRPPAPPALHRPVRRLALVRAVVCLVARHEQVHAHLVLAGSSRSAGGRARAAASRGGCRPPSRRRAARGCGAASPRSRSAPCVRGSSKLNVARRGAARTGRCRRSALTSVGGGLIAAYAARVLAR